MTTAVNSAATDPMDAEAVLAPDGVLAASIPHYEDRPEQRAMAAAVSSALADERAMLIEAGTGTGKTLAYLVPALLSGKRVVVSTGTRALQDQIARRDIPLLQELLPRPFTWAALKGVSNYVCRRRLLDLVVERPPGDLGDQLAVAHEWALESVTGDRSELSHLAENAPIWSRITNTPETRLGSRCPHFERCFVTRARRRADKADLVLVNHHLFFADLALRNTHPGARVLPDYDAVVFDEAHQLEDVITEHFGLTVSTLRFSYLSRDARAALDRVSGTSFRPSPARLVIEHVERCAGDLFGQVRHVLVAAAGDNSGRVELPEGLFEREAVRDAWWKLDTALDDLGRHAGHEAQSDDDEIAEAASGIARRCGQLRDDLATMAEHTPGIDDTHVQWGDVSRRGVVLRAAPIEVTNVLGRDLLTRTPSAIFTSATLTTADQFDYMRDRLGFDDSVGELQVESPFAYGEQAMLYVPRDLPEPRDAAAGAAIAARIHALVTMTDGRAFVLFTSHRGMRDAERRCRDDLAKDGLVLLVQNQEPRASLLERFRLTERAVLFGTGSFWEGIDVPGDALSLVIIDKLPFAPPTDPLVAARTRRVDADGGDAFMELQVPQAALALKQGFGRLIRRRDDRGIVAVLDPRIVTRRYGRTFIDTLPTDIPRTSSLEQVRRWWDAS